MGVNLRTLVWLVFRRKLESKPRRKERRGPARDSGYREWIRSLSCVGCGSRWQIEAAHTGPDGGMSQKASDYSCIPLCRSCHTTGRNAYHRVGKEQFERSHGFDCAEVVRALNIVHKAEREVNAGGVRIWQQ